MAFIALALAGLMFFGVMVGESEKTKAKKAQKKDIVCVVER